ncbi:MAG: hypothetical protein JNL22_08825 [Bacteroidales bacterium]|nr:hypothetical protein [Bacteroidales bacterium]
MAFIIGDVDPAQVAVEHTVRRCRDKSTTRFTIHSFITPYNILHTTLQKHSKQQKWQNPVFRTEKWWSLLRNMAWWSWLRNMAWWSWLRNMAWWSRLRSTTTENPDLKQCLVVGRSPVVERSRDHPEAFGRSPVVGRSRDHPEAFGRSPEVGRSRDHPEAFGRSPVAGRSRDHPETFGRSPVVERSRDHPETPKCGLGRNSD